MIQRLNSKSMTKTTMTMNRNTSTLDMSELYMNGVRKWSLSK